MAFVTIQDEVYIHRASDLAQFVAIYLGAVSEEAGVPGQTRRYANGVVRSVTGTGTFRRLQVDMPYLQRSALLTLESWAGLPVMLRDPTGRKLFGVFFAVQVQDQPISDVELVVRATIALEELTMSEEV